MIKFFHKKPRPNNEAYEELALMLLHEEEVPTYRRNLLDQSRMDFSLTSLKDLDNFLDEIRTDEITEDDLLRLVLRTGSYVGEVMRRNSGEGFQWLEFKEACKASASMEALGLQLGTVAVLWSAPDHVCFPLAKILKFLDNGREDSTFAFASVLILRDSIETPT